MTKKQFRAYALIETKDASDDKRVIRGIATSASVDRMGDIVEMEGVTVAADIPLFLYHDSRLTVGRAMLEKPTKKGIPFEARLPLVSEDGALKDRVDEAWQMVRYGLITAVSIGFQASEYSYIEGGGVRFLETEILELSLVPVPAQPEAVITSVKANDPAARAALLQQIKTADEAARRARQGNSGARSGDLLPAGKTGSPGAPGSTSPASGGQTIRQGTNVKTLQQLLDEQSTKSARMNELIELRNKENRRFNTEEAAEFKQLGDEVADLDEEITVKRFQERNAAGATAVKGGNGAEGSGSRGGITIISKKADPDDKFKGQSFIRLQIAKALAFMAFKEGNIVSPLAFAQERWGKTHPNLVNVVKAAVAGGGTGSGEWGAELAQSNTRYTGDFIEYLYSKTVFDKLPLRPVPARVHIKGQDGAATGYWVGESKAIPVSKADFSDVELTPLKAAALAVVSKELLQDSSPSAEMLVRDAIVQASSQRVDTTFLGSAAASAGVSPAGILNGLVAKSPSGTDAAAIRADWQALVTDFITAKNASGLVHVMHPTLAMAMGVLVNALGQPEFPDITEEGGTLFKRPVYTGDNVTTGNWIVLKPSDIWKIGDTGVEISMSDSATIEQNDAPQGAGDTPTAASATLMSLWQTEQVGFKVVRPINYAKRRSGAVTYLSDAEYGGVVS
jgi:HK97 family phage prohead protease